MDNFLFVQQMCSKRSCVTCLSSVEEILSKSFSHVAISPDARRWKACMAAETRTKLAAEHPCGKVTQQFFDFPDK